MRVKKLGDGFGFSAWVCRDTAESCLGGDSGRLCLEPGLEDFNWYDDEPFGVYLDKANCDIARALMKGLRKGKKRRVEITVRFV